MLKSIRTSWSGRIILFLVLAYGIAWALEGLGLAMSNGRYIGELTAFGVFGPAVAGITFPQFMPSATGVVWLLEHINAPNVELDDGPRV